MVKRLDALIEMQQQEVNRLDVAESVIQTEIQSHIEQLNLRIQQLRQDIRSHIDNDPDLKHQNDLLLSIPGIGEKTIACLPISIPLLASTKLKNSPCFEGARRVSVNQGI
ncbi:MAG: hypothetical protein GXP11_10480 [Gammaproteobacteria bacterium]|nr:hypothetical protein [Gammaproteobacteria bacterium]